MSAIVRPGLRRKALALAFLSSLIFLLTLPSASASAPVMLEPRESKGTPITGGIVQTPGEAATPTSPRTSEATSQRAGDIQAKLNDAKDTSGSVIGNDGNGRASLAPVASQDRDAVEAFYDATGGPILTIGRTVFEMWLGPCDHRTGTPKAGPSLLGQV